MKKEHIKHFIAILIIALCPKILLLACELPPSMSAEDCKRLVSCCGDSIAYEQISRYSNMEFDQGAQFYYLLLVACKYPHVSKFACAVAENRLITDMYRSKAELRMMSDICRATSLAILEEGIRRKEWASAEFAYQYYAHIEADSAKSIDYLKMSYSQGFRDLDSNFVEKKIEEAIDKWVNRYKTLPIQTPITPNICRFPTDSLRQKVRCAGDSIAYQAMISNSRSSKNNYAFRECLYDAILMVCYYNYMPAKEHVCEILRTFYSEGEEPSNLYIRLLEIFGSISFE